MSKFMKSALFVFTAECSALKESIIDNDFGVVITPVELEQFVQDPKPYLQECSHVVVATDLAGLKSVIELSQEYSFSIGLLPARADKRLRAYYELPTKADDLIKLALGNDPQTVDLIFANDEVVLLISRFPST